MALDDIVRHQYCEGGKVCWPIVKGGGVYAVELGNGTRLVVGVYDSWFGVQTTHSIGGFYQFTHWVSYGYLGEKLRLSQSDAKNLADFINTQILGGRLRDRDLQGEYPPAPKPKPKDARDVDSASQPVFSPAVRFVRFLKRVPNPGVCRVVSMDWEKGTLSVTNGMHAYSPNFDEVFECDVSGLPLQW